MLSRLTLENFFLIRYEEIYFERGLNVITGETGTGKSLTVSSLLFLMGQEGEYPEGTSVEAEFLLENEPVVIRREVVKGRSRYYLNGRGSTKRVVEDILSSNLLLQGQNDRIRITRADFQRDAYDRFAGAIEIRRQVEVLYQQAAELREKIKSLREKRLERELRKRLIEEETMEVESLGLRVEDYEELRRRIEEINLGEKINKLVFEALSGMEESSEGLKKTLRTLRGLTAYKDVKDYCERVELMLDSLADIRRGLEALAVSYSQEELNLLNEKLYKVQRLERKYRMNYQELWSYVQRLKEELRILSEEEEPEKLEKILDDLERQLDGLYKELSEKRLKAKEDFEKRVKEYLQNMGLERASFEVTFEEREGRYGREQVKFLFSSYGRDVREIGQIASGGEISRLSLALFMLSPPAQTYVLDEIDTGVSGTTSIRLARLLRELSEKAQLIVVTHSPAIASASKKHFSTRKEYVEDAPTIRLVELDEEERLLEIARLMGKVSDKTLEGAKELIREVCSV